MCALDRPVVGRGLHRTQLQRSILSFAATRDAVYHKKASGMTRNPFNVNYMHKSGFVRRGLCYRRFRTRQLTDHKGWSITEALLQSEDRSPSTGFGVSTPSLYCTRRPVFSLNTCTFKGAKAEPSYSHCWNCGYARHRLIGVGSSMRAHVHVGTLGPRQGS
jgi:hypothetical protein